MMEVKENIEVNKLYTLIYQPNFLHKKADETLEITTNFS